MLGTELIGWFAEVLGKRPDGVQVQPDRGRRIMPDLEVLQHPLSKWCHSKNSFRCDHITNRLPAEPSTPWNVRDSALHLPEGLCSMLHIVPETLALRTSVSEDCVNIADTRSRCRRSAYHGIHAKKIASYSSVIIRDPRFFGPRSRSAQMRDDFKKAIKEVLARRVAYLCSNPVCRRPTVGPHTQPTKSVLVGEAAHITGAASGGPRFDASLTQEERGSAPNGIWLCSKCAKLIDRDESRFPVSLLKKWKDEAEHEALAAIGGTMTSVISPLVDPNMIPKIVVEEYLAKFAAEAAVTTFVDRRFEMRTEWLESFKFRSFGARPFQELQPNLDQVLEVNRALVLGEPGSGKTTVLHEAAGRLGARLSESVIYLPIVVRLRSYWGSLPDLLTLSVPAEAFLRSETVDGVPLKRFYLFDGIDEIPPQFLTRAIEEIRERLDADPLSSCLATCRQAFYERRREALELKWNEYYILPFNGGQIDEFVKLRDVLLQGFHDGIRQLDLAESIGNPLILSSLVATYQTDRRLPSTRSQAVSRQIDKILGVRPSAKPTLLRQALRLIALAMEINCDNVISEETVSRLLCEGLGLRVSEIDEAMDELSKHFLVLGADGYAFQVRSFGEYLAAEAMKNANLDRVKSLLTVSGELNESWSNTLSYLVESNQQARRYFIDASPVALLGAHPSAFTPEEKRLLYQRSKHVIDLTPVLLHENADVKAHLLARFVPAEAIAILRGEAHDGSVEIRSNAFMLLGCLGDTAILDSAAAVACDMSHQPEVRAGAMVAVMNISDSRVLLRLVAGVRDTDPLKNSLINTIGVLANRDVLDSVFPLLEGAPSFLGNAYLSLLELKTEDDVSAILNYFARKPQSILNSQLAQYVGHIWKLIPQMLSPRIVAQLGRMRWRLRVFPFGTCGSGISSLPIWHVPMQAR